jgi:hypothetical protein
MRFPSIFVSPQAEFPMSGRSCVICWPGTLIVGLTSWASMQGQVQFYAVAQLFYKAKHMFCYRTKESNIYVLLRGPEFKPHASLIQQLTNSLLPGLYCKINFFSFDKNLNQHVANPTVEPNRVGNFIGVCKSCFGNWHWAIQFLVMLQNWYPSYFDFEEAY